MRFLAGEPGRDIVLARRHGTTWFIGAMTANEARTQRVSLKFLPSGKYHASVWEDGNTPNDVSRTEKVVTSRDTLDLRLSAAGGAAVIVER